MQFEFSLSQEQTQSLSAAQIQSLQLLAMDNFELRQRMETEYLENPLLEYERNASFSQIRKGYVNDEQKHWELSDKEKSLPELIMGQLNFHDYSKKEWNLIKFLVENLDDQGFFQTDIQKLAAASGVKPELILRLLSDLKQLEPRGIFSSDIRECLLLQLKDWQISDPLVYELVEEHLESLSRGEINALARKLSVPAERIRKALAVISRLNPRPLNGLDTGSTAYVVPDILLKLDPVSGKLEAFLNDDWLADYHLSDYYIRMIHTTEDAQLREYFKQKYQRAKLLIDGIEQRRATLLAIGNYLGRTQRQYLLGKGEKITVTMTEAAVELELAVSTVSRAVKGKYVQHPAGCTAMKDLFVTPVRKEAPATASRDVIKETLRKWIEQENKDRPFSDADLAEKFRERQISISRRTVAKYRESLGIPGCFDRKKY